MRVLILLCAYRRSFSPGILLFFSLSYGGPKGRPLGSKTLPQKMVPDIWSLLRAFPSYVQLSQCRSVVLSICPSVRMLFRKDVFYRPRYTVLPHLKRRLFFLVPPIVQSQDNLSKGTTMVGPIETDKSGSHCITKRKGELPKCCCLLTSSSPFFRGLMKFYRTWNYLLRFPFISVSCLSFLDASSHLYMRICPSTRWSVCPLVRLSVGPSVSNA